MANFFANRKTTLLFDWNKTLVDTSRAFDRAFLEVLGMHAGRWSPEKPPEAQEALRIYKKERSLRKALASYPLHVDSAFAKRFFGEVRKKRANHIQLLPGVEDTLAKLAKKYKLAIVSNSPDIHPRQAGLEDVIPDKYCITAHMAGARKPHPHIFKKAARMTGSEPSACVMIGNSWKTDICGAAAAGMDAVWLHGKARKKMQLRKIRQKKVVVIRQFQQLLEIF